MMIEKRICYSGGAQGADVYFEELALRYQCDVIHYSYKTSYHNRPFKYELSVEEFREGLEQLPQVSNQLKRFNYKPYVNLLARNYFQIKKSQQVFAVGILEKDESGSLCRVKGGTGWTIQMAINAQREIYVFDQKLGEWFCWNHQLRKFTKCELPKITTTHFTGVGTRNINLFGIQAITALFENSFK